jgi:hypothetical protein
MKKVRYEITRNGSEIKVLDTLTNTMHKGTVNENNKVSAKTAIALSVITKALRGGK